MSNVLVIESHGPLGINFVANCKNINGEYHFGKFQICKMKSLVICLLLVAMVNGSEMEKRRRCRKVTQDFNKCTRQ